MSCIHYKFRSALEYDTITFDGLSISLADLKRSIITQKKFGKNSDFDLEVTNAQTKEEYKDEMTMIPKNSSVVVRRIPVGPKSKAQLAAERSSPFASGEQKTSGFQDYQVIKSSKLSKVADLANADASEEDKLKAMMKQSGEDWDPSQYVRGRRPYAPGVPLSQSYVCFRCGKPGHFIRNCPTNGDVRFDVPKVKRTTGIPRTFLGTLEDRSSPTNRSSPSTQGEDSKIKEKVTEPANKKVSSAQSGNKKVPSELRCPSCSNLLTDAVLIPCCGTSYCDDCIRNYLLENEQQCPSCGTENVSPDTLVINKQLRQAVNTFKNARPASPFPNQAVITKSTSATSLTVANNTEVKQPQSVAMETTESASASASAASDSKPAENKAVKEINDADNKSKEGSPKPVKQVTSQPQQIRVHHRDGTLQQVAGLHQGGVPFDPRRRQGDFLPRGPPRIPEPIIPHGLPPEHVPRVPAIRPGMGGPPHPGPPMKVPNYVPASIGGMHAVVPRPPIPRMPPVPTLVGAPVPHRPPFGPPMFDPLHHATDIPRSLTPPMSEREFYKIQKKLKSRTKKKREHSSATSSSRPRKEPKKEGGIFDFDDELSEYRELQKTRQRNRSRSLTPSRSLSRSPSRSRSFSRSRSRSRSSASLARSPTPEGWDESRSPSPVPSRGGTASAEEKKRKHKKRKKEQKSKGRKKQKTLHKEEQQYTEPKEETAVVKEEDKGTDKKKHRKQKEKADGMEEEKDKLQEVGKEKVKKEAKARKENEKGKTKEKDKKKLSDKERERGKETEKQSEKKEGNKSKEGKEKKKKDKDKKDESSSGKKRKSKKKHKKHKRHKKEKSKEEKTGDEDEDKSDRLATKEGEHQDESSDGGNLEVETATDDEKDEQGTDQAEPHGESSGSEETERIEKGKREGVGRKSDDETLGSDGSDEERGLKEFDEEKLLENGSNDEEEQEEKIEKKLAGNVSDIDIERDHLEEKLLESDKENEQEAENKLRGDGSDDEEEQGHKGSEEKQLESRNVAENDTDSGRNKAKRGEDGGNMVQIQGSKSDKETGNRPIRKTSNGNNKS